MVLLWAMVLATGPANAGEVWTSSSENGTISFTDSPPSDSGFVQFNVDGPPPEVIHVNPENFPNIDDYDGLILQSAWQHGVKPWLVKAVMLAESGMNPKAVSRAGAQGLMQLMPPTAKDLGVTNAFDPAECIDAGTRYLAKMLDLFGGDTRLALAGYNAGPNRVKRVGRVPDIDETQTYVKRVMALQHYFQRKRPIAAE
ncbi:MAG: lytic transglycosylase domain-containing protein [Myxococcota bacterium]|nr:lytic transglycosylase domain-containing protein [Myxococcota bacterium]MEC9389954.1 lytic transglycosylase domain-containing protein [Myxococcota bacterium]